MTAKLKDWAGRSLGLGIFASAGAHAEYGINFPTPATQGAREIYDIHMLTLGIATVLMLVVTVIVTYSVFAHRKSRGAEADQQFHESWFGRWGWISVPVLVLGVDLAIASSAQQTLERLWLVPKDGPLLDVKVTGHQWWWEYDYPDHGIRLESRPMGAAEAGGNYLREVDEPLVVPTGTRIRFLHTSADVLHAFWVPEFGFKKDAIPGYVTETWAEIDKEGIFRGQCAELCGTWHSRMPIVIKAVSPAAFDGWVAERKVALQTATAEAAADRQWSKEELFARGEQAYMTRCAACHQANGEGLPPAFPALKGSKVVLGPVEGHLDIVVNGRPGTAMQAWGQLNDLDVAALLTYERNAWGNESGDVVQPRQVASWRGDTKSVAR